MSSFGTTMAAAGEVAFVSELRSLGTPTAQVPYVGLDNAWDIKPKTSWPMPPPHKPSGADKTLLEMGAKHVRHGGKDDAGKHDPGLLFQGCAFALSQVTKVLDGGARKYAADSWQSVPDGIRRYRAAFERHKQEVDLHGLGAVNPDFGLLHIDHMITDLLFIRELMHKEGL